PPSADGELPGCVGSLPAPPPAPPARRLRLRPPRGHPRRRGGRRSPRRARRARARARRVLLGRALVAGPAGDRADHPRVLAATRAVPPADRGEPDGPAPLRVRNRGRPEGVLPPLGRPRRPSRARPAPPGRRPRAGRRERRRLHRAAARQLPAGRAARSRARPCLPAARRPPHVRRDRARQSNSRAARVASLRGVARSRPPRCRTRAPGADRRPDGAGGRPLRTWRARGARCARVRALGRVHPAAASVADSPRSGSLRAMTAEQAYAEVERITRRRARNFAYGIMVLPREKRRAIAAIYAFARSVDDVADGELSVDEKRVQLEQLRAVLSAPRGLGMSVSLDVPVIR